MRKIHQTALDLQDGVNLLAISNTLFRVCKELSKRGEGTDAIRKHPAVTVILDKMNDLNGRPDFSALNKAFEVCENEAGFEALKDCPCGSGKEPRELLDARGIPCGKICDDCEKEKKKKYRPEVFYDGSYEHDEPLDED